MARGTTSGTNHFSGVSLTVYPVSVSFWFLLNNTGVAQNLWSMTEPTNDSFVISWNSINLNCIATNFTVNSGTASYGGGLSANTWYNVCCVFSSSSSRSIYLNGGSKATNTTVVNVNTAGFDAVRLGAFRTIAGAPNTFFADYGLWNVALTDADAASLGKGFSCSRIQPAALVQHVPLVRGSQDLRGNMAEVGAVGVGTSHPPIIGAIAA